MPFTGTWRTGPRKARSPSGRLPATSTLGTVPGEVPGEEDDEATGEGSVIVAVEAPPARSEPPGAPDAQADPTTTMAAASTRRRRGPAPMAPDRSLRFSSASGGGNGGGTTAGQRSPRSGTGKIVVSQATTVP